MRGYLDRVTKADQCAQYVDEIGIATISTTQQIHNNRTVSECLRNAGLKLTFDKHEFGVTEVEVLGRTITPDGIAPKTTKSKNDWQMCYFQIKKQVERYIRFVNYYRNCMPRPTEQPLGFSELMKADKQIKVAEDLLDYYKRSTQH